MDLTISPFTISDWNKKIQLPQPESHKGQNGKLLIVGGSELFHAASKWSLDVASKFVDMVFYASTPSNNALVKEAKTEFWNGIVIERDEIHHYGAEADCILVGPGMERSAETVTTTKQLIAEFSTKKWVIDAGALQMIAPSEIPTTAIITPHPQELQRLLSTISPAKLTVAPPHSTDEFLQIWQQIYSTSGLTPPAATIIKGHRDLVISGGKAYEISGGNPGMTKGGTGDVLAGLVAALYCTNTAEVSAVIGSYCNKLAGDTLHTSVGPFFNTSDLVNAIPRAVWAVAQPA